jgi:hypothetical protein
MGELIPREVADLGEQIELGDPNHVQPLGRRTVASVVAMAISRRGEERPR